MYPKIDTGALITRMSYISYYYIRDMVGRNVIKLSYISTNEQNVDIFTKPLAKLKIVYFRGKLGMTLL